MQQIELYYTDNLKYLKLGDYIKYFEDESIDDMLAKIKNPETPVKIRTLKEYLIPHKLSNKSKVIYTYEEIEEIPLFDYEQVESDFDNGVSYALYPVNEKWQEILGKEIYFCRRREIQLFLVKDRDVLTFLYEDMPKLKSSVLQNYEINEKLLEKMFFTDEELDKHDKGMVE